MARTNRKMIEVYPDEYKRLKAIRKSKHPSMSRTLSMTNIANWALRRGLDQLEAELETYYDMLRSGQFKALPEKT